MVDESVLKIGPLIFFFFLAASCGPTCPELKISMTSDATMTEDVSRLNALVDLRKAAIKEAETPGLDQFAMKRLKFSVTALELAIRAQLRIIKASPKVEDSPLYSQNLRQINVIRCDLDEVVVRNDHRISDSLGKTLHSHESFIAGAFKRECDLTSTEFAQYLEEGIESEEKKSP